MPVTQLRKGVTSALDSCTMVKCVKGSRLLLTHVRCGDMAGICRKALRIEYTGAWCQVMKRGRCHEITSSGKDDCQDFLELQHKGSAVYPAGQPAGLALAATGEAFGLEQYISVRRVVCRMKRRIEDDGSLRRRFEAIKRHPPESRVDLTP